MKENRLTLKRIIKRTIALFIFFIFLILISILTFYLSTHIYRLIGWSPKDVLRYMINDIITFILVVIVIIRVRKIALKRKWPPEDDIIAPIIEALEKISAGDFNIRLNKKSQTNKMLNELSSTVNKMALELGQLEDMRQEFISNVSHEIKSPLTSIKGFAEALESKEISFSTKKHYLSIIKQESNRLSRLSDNLLRLASLESEVVKLKPSLYRLDEQIRDLILSFEPQWLEKEIEMELFLDEIKITADRDLLSQVWSNLISNSIKYTPIGGKVKLYLSIQGSQIVFKIKDNGIGISSEDQTHIFERFYKTDKSRQPVHKGSGLGLAIAKKIIELHQGKIEVLSELKKGTTFVIYLVKN